MPLGRADLKKLIAVRQNETVPHAARAAGFREIYTLAVRLVEGAMPARSRGTTPSTAAAIGVEVSP